MNKRLVVVLVVWIAVFSSLCVESSKVSLIQTPTPQATVTPPPGMMTPPTPEYYIGEFVKHFNGRNLTELYDLFSERVRQKHSIDELKTVLDFAEDHNITIVRWKILSGGYFPGNTTVKMVISRDGKLTNKTIVIPVLYRSTKMDSIVSSQGYIDDWIVDDIVATVKKTASPRASKT